MDRDIRANLEMAGNLQDALLGPDPADSNDLKFIKTVQPNKYIYIDCSVYHKLSSHSALFFCPQCSNVIL